VKRLLFFVLLAGCAKAEPEPEIKRVSVMTFNVENLFDTKHDPDKNDLAFLPLAGKETREHKTACQKMKRALYRDQCLEWDWSSETLAVKMKRLGKVILSVGDGRGPDILLLQEVENKAILERLRTGPLADAGYGPGLLLEANDARGIDQAILTRLPVVSGPTLYRDAGGTLTRGLLIAGLSLPDGTVLQTGVVHFPSPAAPRRLREGGLRILNNYRQRISSASLMLVGGDFNITAEEEAEFRVFARLAGEQWALAHELGCKKCPGTHYYAPKKSWSFLDVVLISKNMDPNGSAPWTIDAASVRLVDSARGQKDKRGRPLRFDPMDRTGISDHFPLVVDLVKRR